MMRPLRAHLPWLYFVLWSLLIFALIPRASELQRAVTERFGDAIFRWLVASLFGLGALIALTWVIRRKPAQGLKRLTWITAIVILAWIWIWRLRGKAEALHWVEYGVLSLLAFQALRAHLADAGIYPVAAALTALVGTVDEIMQWLMPGRFFDLADIVLNASIGILAQLLIARGWRPDGLTARLTSHSGLWLVRLLIAQGFLLLFCVSATPSRVAAWAEHQPSLAYLGAQASTRMVEYGHLYEDPEHGRFRSRLSPTELARTDAEHGAEMAALLDRHATTRYGDFTTLFPPHRDPFAFELRSHLFFRDRHLARARKAQSEHERRRHLTLALGEQLILERHFGRALSLSTFTLEPAERKRLTAQAELGPSFESQVDRTLITAFSKRQAQGTLLVVLLLLTVLERLLLIRRRGNP